VEIKPANQAEGPEKGKGKSKDKAKEAAAAGKMVVGQVPEEIAFARVVGKGLLIRQEFRALSGNARSVERLWLETSQPRPQH
jgi:hypothetical protein